MALLIVVIGSLIFLLSMSVLGAQLALFVGRSSNLEIDTNAKHRDTDKSNVKSVTRLRYVNIFLLGMLLIEFTQDYEEGRRWNMSTHALRIIRGLCFPQVAFWTLLSQASGENFAGFRGACFSKPPNDGGTCLVRFGLDAEDAVPSTIMLLMTLLIQVVSLMMHGCLLVYFEKRWGNSVAGRQAVIAPIGREEARTLKKQNARRQKGMRRAGLVQDDFNAGLEGCEDRADAVVADNLRIYFTEDKTGDRVKAVDGVNLCLQPGEVFCLLGHNGAGKSTTISALSGLNGVSQGSIHIGAVEMSEENKLHCQQVTGLCLQDDLLWDQMFVVDHLDLVARLRGLKNADNSALIEDSRLANHLQKRTCELSGGWKRILSCVSAFVGDAEFIILDEPTTGVDPANRRLCWNFINKKRLEGKIILLTTHYMDEAEALADRIAIMADGQVRCCGTTNQLKKVFNCGYVIGMTVSTNFISRGVAIDEAAGNTENREIIHMETQTAADDFYKLQGVEADDLSSCVTSLSVFRRAYVEDMNTMHDLEMSESAIASLNLLNMIIGSC